MEYNIIIYFHYIGVMSMMGMLLAEHILFQPGMAEQSYKRLARIDLFYGIAALVTLASGLLRFLHYGKGFSYYMQNPLFHIKLTLFIVMGILSAYPTIRYLRWRRMEKRGEVPGILPQDYKRIHLLIRMQLTLLAIIPFLAVLVARGVRL